MMFAFWFLGLSLVDAYNKGEQVSISMNKVWPFSNPSETYSYYDFPFCKPAEGVSHHWMTLGQVLRGDRLVSSNYEIKFREEKPKTTICEREMTQDDIDLFKSATKEHYLFEIFIADLPVNRPMGIFIPAEESTTGKDQYMLLVYFNLEIGYNGNHVVSVNLSSDIRHESLIDITNWKPGTKVPFSYSIKWVESTIPYEQALKTQVLNMVQAAHSSMDIHWLAIINSFVLVLLIMSLLLLIIVRIVRSDLTSLLQITDEEFGSIEEEVGWKLLHADVFRAPQHRMLLCAAVGAGVQLLAMILMVVLVGCIGIFYQRGAVASSAVIAYMLTSALAGFVSTSLYTYTGGEKWAWTIFVTGIMFAGPAFGVWSILNTIAIFYGSTAALPFGTIVWMLILYAGVTFPLTVLGGIVGRKRALRYKAEVSTVFPTKTSRLPREIPDCKWYQGTMMQFFAVGFLPFPSIYIELHYIFNSVWGVRIYTLYGMLLLAFLMLVLVCATVTLLFTYFHLNSEDYRWWWRSMASGPAVALFFYLYCIYYFLQTSMWGFMQYSFYFLYSLLVAWALALVLGSVSFIVTMWFVVYIYARIKTD